MQFDIIPRRGQLIMKTIHPTGSLLRDSDEKPTASSDPVLPRMSPLKSNTIFIIYSVYLSREDVL